MTRILIVEDEDGIREIEKIVLQKERYEVEAVGDPQDALKIAAEKAFDLMILDVMMPGMDGFELIQRLRQTPSNARTPAIFITALDDQKDRIKGLNVGAVEYFTKPFSTKELLEKIQEVLISTGRRPAK